VCPYQESRVHGITSQFNHIYLKRRELVMTGIPYLWQIKMPGKWCSFSTAENEKIEKGFTDLLNVVSAQVCDIK
jgi:hypothetical protein